MQDIIQICRVSGERFVVSVKDQEFYKKMGVSIPTLCPDERLRRRLSWRNDRCLYNSVCQLCKKPMISIFPSDTNFVVYCQDCWWSDKWDPMQYGREFDFNRPFFEQFAELLQVVPMCGLMNAAPTLENSDYVNYMSHAKNCYLIFASNFLEDCMYSEYLWESKDTFDCSFSTKLELCYECLDCDKLYGCKYLQNSRACHDCIFGIGLNNCEQCFGCVNMRNKKFCFYNEQMSENDYKNRVDEILQDPKRLKAEGAEFYEFSLKFPRKFAQHINCENAAGDSIKNCKNVSDCFDGYGGEDLKWMINFPGDVRDCYDISGCAQMELAIEGHALFPGYNFRFCNGILNGGNDLTYCAYTDGGQTLFGCVGTKKAQYCILNKQYSEEEYIKKANQIVEHMKQSGEWGEFFPIEISPFAYNESYANSLFPLSKEVVLGKEYKWRIDDVHTSKSFSDGESVIDCHDCGKNFRLLKKELAFYDNLSLPIPILCPSCRYSNRITNRPPRKLWLRNCDKCSMEMHTVYAPDRPEIVYCEECYLKEVY